MKDCLEKMVEECKEAKGTLTETYFLNGKTPIQYCPFLPKVDCVYRSDKRIKVPENAYIGIKKVKYYRCRPQ